MSHFIPTAICNSYNPRTFPMNQYIKTQPSQAISAKSNVWKQGLNNRITISLSGSIVDDMITKNIAGKSQIGTDSMYITGTESSMYLAYLDPPFESFTIDGMTFNDYLTDPTVLRNGCTNGAKTVNGSCNNSQNFVPGHTPLHEILHSLSFLHEHQNNLNNSDPIVFTQDFISQGLDQNDIVTNDPNSVCYSGKCYSQNSKSASFIENILVKYSDTNLYSGSNFDQDSIMLYALPQTDLVSGHMDTNYALSATDKQKLTELYPKSIRIDISVIFSDSKNQVSWKKYFIKKLLTDQIEPITGIVFTYPNIADGVGLVPSTNIPTISTPTSVTNIPNTPTPDTNIITSLSLSNPLIITAIVLGSLILLFIIYKLLLAKI